MEQLRLYLNALSTPAQAEFARACGTTIGYLRKALSKGQRLGEGLCIAIERETGGQVPCEQLRPDRADTFTYLRQSASASMGGEGA